MENEHTLPDPGQWAGREMFHGTSQNGASNILEKGVSIDQSSGGYFGWGFYAAWDSGLAQDNYADMAEDGGAVLSFQISPNARILDLRDYDDCETWNKISKYGNEIIRPGFYKDVVRAGFDGVYDNSFQGVCIYNPRVVLDLKLQDEPAEDSKKSKRMRP